MKTRYDVADKGVLIDSGDEEGNVFLVRYIGSEDVKRKIAALEHGPGVQKILRKNDRRAENKREELHREAIASQVFAIAGHFKSDEHREVAQKRGTIQQEDVEPGFKDVAGQIYDDSLDNRRELTERDLFLTEVILPTANDSSVFGIVGADDREAIVSD